jgi:mannose-6-phosphate isomerase-like protein (cupin superfamily)
VQIVRLEDRQQFVTADGSLIRELVGIPSGNSKQQSIAEAIVPAGGETVEHHHRTSEEVYLFTSGEGRMRLGDEEAKVQAGDTVVIAPGVLHKLWNTGSVPLVFLCCCVPPYRDSDTVFSA